MDTSATDSTIADRFALHRANPHISVSEHARRRLIELGVGVMARRRVYLDKCFWIHLRHARAGLPCPTGSMDLLSALSDGVSAGDLVCPVSDALFLELMKQGDPITRRATAELIDDLGGGIALCAEQIRVGTEVAHFIHAGTGRSVHPLEHLVWTKVPYVLGFQPPTGTAFGGDEQRVIRKAFFDHLWTFPLARVVEAIGTEWPTVAFYSDLAPRLNRDNEAHADSMKSFAQVYRDEINGVLELAAPIAVDVLHKMASKELGPVDTPSAEQHGDLVRQALGLLRGAVRRPPGKRALRTLHIGAVLHASLRWNRTQKVNANDLFDFHHAEAALGYCDAFMTDGPMHTLLAQRCAELGAHECAVMSSVTDAAAWVRSHAGPPG